MTCEHCGCKLGCWRQINGKFTAFVWGCENKEDYPECTYSFDRETEKEALETYFKKLNIRIENGR